MFTTTTPTIYQTQGEIINDLYHKHFYLNNNLTSRINTNIPENFMTLALLSQCKTDEKFFYITIDQLRPSSDETNAVKETLGGTTHNYFQSLERDEANEFLNIYYFPANSKYITNYNGLTENKGISMGLQLDQHHRIKFFTNENGVRIILTSQITDELIKKIIAILPHMFKGQYNLTEDTTKFLYAFAKQDEKVWYDLFMKFWNENKFEELHRKKQLFELFRGLNDATKETHRRRVRELTNEIDRALINVTQWYKAQQDAERMLFALETEETIPHEELVAYLCANKFIKIYNIEQHQIKFSVITPLEYYNPDAATKIIEARINRNGESPITSLLRDVFIDQKLQLITFTNFVVSLANSNYDLINSSRFNQEVLAHPHHWHHKCLGNNKGLLTKALGKQDFIMFFEQCVAANKNLNFYDTVVVDSMVNDIKTNSKHSPCILNLEDNSICTFAQYCEMKKEVK